jgi:hypothetical protein
MAQHAQRKEIPADLPGETQVEHSFEKLDVGGGLDSPARQLQSYLQDQWHEEYLEQTTKWSARKSFLFVLVTCGIMWAGIWSFAQAVF